MATLCIWNIKWKMNGFSNYIILLHRSKYPFPFHFCLLLRDVGPYPTTQHHVFGEHKHINNIETISKIVQIKPSAFVAFLFIWQRKREKLFPPFHANRERIFVTRDKKSNKHKTTHTEMWTTTDNELWRNRY